MGIWRTALRVLVGGLFIGHGTQKLFGWFGGEGLAKTEKSFAKLGLRPARENAIAAGVTETAAGALLAAGAATPLAASALTATMLTAIDRVHARNGVWVTKGGYEYNAVLVAAIVEAGPGTLSIDAARDRERHGMGWAIIALSGGIFGAYVVDALSRRNAEGSASLAHAAANAPEASSRQPA